MKANFNTIINSATPVLVDFYADWCAPCKIQDPILREVAAEISDKARIIKVDVDRNPEIASRFQVRGIPTLLLFREGKVVWRRSGVAEKSQLLETLQEQLP